MIRNNLPWKAINRWASIWWVIWLLVSMYWLGRILFTIDPELKNTQSQLEYLTFAVEKDSDVAANTLAKYHYLIEQQKLNEARNLYTEQRKKSEPNWFESYKERHQEIVSFQGIKIEIIEEKTSASSKVFLVQYKIDRRGRKPRDMLLWFTMLFDESTNSWKINHTTYPLRENWERDYNNACSFHTFEICK
jgi:hypothetical protein